MKEADFEKTVAILEDSFIWDKETLERCPKLFLMIRESYVEKLAARDMASLNKGGAETTETKEVST